MSVFLLCKLFNELVNQLVWPGCWSEAQGCVAGLLRPSTSNNIHTHVKENFWFFIPASRRFVMPIVSLLLHSFVNKVQLCLSAKYIEVMCWQSFKPTFLGSYSLLNTDRCHHGTRNKNSPFWIRVRCKNDTRCSQWNKH